MTFTSHLSLLPRRLTMLLAGAAIALAGLGAATRPARADTEDILRFLAGVIVIAAIVNAVDDNHRPQYVSRWVLPDSCLESVRTGRRTIDVYNARCLGRAGYDNLPGHCRHDFQYQGRNRTGYVAECLYDSGYHPQGGGSGGGWQGDQTGRDGTGHGAGRLPGQCEMTYRQSGQRIDGYWASCLNNAGLHDLPRQCRVTSTGGDHIFNAQCLLNAGYRQGRR